METLGENKSGRHEERKVVLKLEASPREIIEISVALAQGIAVMSMVGSRDDLVIFQTSITTLRLLLTKIHDQAEENKDNYEGLPNNPRARFGRSYQTLF